MSATQSPAKAAHTPGPWVWWSLRGGRPINYDLAHLSGASGKRIISCYGGEGYKALGKTPEDEANARLIAAAPELLAALQDMVFVYKNNNPVDTMISGEYKAALRAISKAEGHA